MTDFNKAQLTLAHGITSSTLPEEKKEVLMKQLAAAKDEDGLKVVQLFFNAQQFNPSTEAPTFVGKYNQRLGIIRVSGRAEYLIKDLKEWTGSGPVETWKNQKDASNYLRRLGLPMCETTFNPATGKAERTNCFDAWQGSPLADCYSGVTYRPNGQKKVNGQFNLWRGWGVIPRPGTKHELFLELLEKGFCNGNTAYYAYVVSYLAHMVQKPEERPGTALVIQSGQGTGKGTFIEVLTAMIGNHNSAGDVCTKDLMGGFNSKLAHALLINVNEATFSGNHEQVEVMKKLATEPYIRCEYKGYEPFDFPNFARLLITTNNINWGRIDHDDRRYLVLEPSLAYKQDKSFFTQIRKDMFEDGGVENLMQYLLELDISEWDSFALPKRSTGLETLFESMNRDSSLKFFFELAGNGEVRLRHPASNFPDVIHCGDTVAYGALYEAYSQYCHGNSLLIAQGTTRFTYTSQLLGMPTQRSRNSRQVAILPMNALRKKFESIYLSKWDLDWDVVFDGTPIEPLVVFENQEQAEPTQDKCTAKVLEAISM